jgi:hypothetical protein
VAKGYPSPQIPPAVGCLRKFDGNELPETQVRKHGVNGGRGRMLIVTENDDRMVEMKELDFLSLGEMPPMAVYYFQEKIAQNPAGPLTKGQLSGYRHITCTEGVSSRVERIDPEGLSTLFLGISRELSSDA